MDKNHDERLIEYDIPLQTISEQSVREKSVRHGPLSTLHVWWAAKPQIASRAAIYASFIPKPTDQKGVEREKEFISQLANWDNINNGRILRMAREKISKNFVGKAPKVLDTFAGRGTIPLEAARLGCDIYSIELNPVAVLMNKACLEYPSSYHKRGDSSLEYTIRRKKEDRTRNLSKDFSIWAEWVLKEAEREIGKFYPPDSDGHTPIAYFWMRTIKCKKPTCGAEIPLATNQWLAKFDKKNREDIALKLLAYEDKKVIDFKVVRGQEIDFDPSNGTASGATADCPVCKSTVDANTMKKDAQEGRMGERMATVIYDREGTGKEYCVPKSKDKWAFEEAKVFLKKRTKDWKGRWPLIPHESLPRIGTLGFRVQRYGIQKWGDLFNSRQKLAIITFIEKIREAYQKMHDEFDDEQYAKVITTYLAMVLDGFIHTCSSFCNLNYTGGRGVGSTFRRPALPMSWQYAETNPFNPVGSNWESRVDYLLKTMDTSFIEKDETNYVEVRQGTATRLPYPDEHFDAVITDPPYYDNIPYSDFSDFFYVWLKRTIGDLYPELFSTPLTPKSEEIIQEPSRHGGSIKEAKAFFEKKLTKAFKEICRVLKPEGIACIMFAHKSTAAWETLINSILESGLVVTASWPIHTEKKGRPRAQKSAALASSIFFVCRKVKREKTAYFEDIRADIRERIHERLDYFWKVGIAGADFFVSAIGPAIEVFGRYKNVKKYSGEQVQVIELLRFIEGYVAEYALNRILKIAPHVVDPEARFYLVWRWTYNNNKIPFDDARLLGQALGFEVSDYMGKDKLIMKSGSDVKVRNPLERKEKFLEKPIKQPASMVDVIHKASVFWKEGEKKKLNEILEESGHLENEHFWMVVQAIAQVLPNGDPEKKMLQGLLAGRKRIEKGPKPTKVTDFM